MKLKLFVTCFIFFNLYFSLAQELVFPPKINLFQYSTSVSKLPLYGFPNIRVWGWSNNGKIAYSIEEEIEGRGGQKIDFIIFDLISDNIIFKLEMDSYDYNDVTDESLYNLFNVTILNTLKAHNIIRQKTYFLRFPFRKNNKEYNSQINNIKHKRDEFGLFDNVVSKYSVLVTADDKKKIIGNFNPVSPVTGFVYLCGYFLSPFENRVLVVIAEEHWGSEGTELTYRFSGCNLEVGFN